MRRDTLAFLLLAWAVTACSAPSSGGSGAGPSTVTVAASDAMAFVPGDFEFVVGQTVRFEVTNEGELRHEFYLGDAAAQAAHAAEMAEMADSDMRHDEPTGLSLDPGETGTLEYTFSEAGQLFVACHEPGHYEAGMVAEVTVEG